MIDSKSAVIRDGPIMTLDARPCRDWGTQCVHSTRYGGAHRLRPPKGPAQGFPHRQMPAGGAHTRTLT